MAPVCRCCSICACSCLPLVWLGLHAGPLLLHPASVRLSSCRVFLRLRLPVETSHTHRDNDPSVYHEYDNNISDAHNDNHHQVCTHSCHLHPLVLAVEADVFSSTVDVPAQKKRDNPAKASQWHDCSSRLRHAGGGFLSTACSCIQTPSTTTVTKTAPPRIDSTSISTVDSTSIITTVDATTTVCTAGTIANPSGPGYFSTACGTSVIPIFTPTPDSATSFDSCLASCAGRTEVSTGACCAVDFDVSTGVCNLQITMSDSSTCTYGYTYTPDPAYDYAIYYNPS